MKKYASHAALCALGLIAGLSIYVVSEQREEIKQKPVAPRFVLLSESSKPKSLEWEQPLIHPTFPPKLVQGEKKFVLK